MFRVILCQEVKESRSLYVHIYIFCEIVSEEFFFTYVPIEYQ